MSGIHSGSSAVSYLERNARQKYNAAITALSASTGIIMTVIKLWMARK